MFENAEIVMEGTWIYGGIRTCNLRIVKWDVIYGSGDYEDSPEIRDDKEIECYYVEFESMTERNDFRSRSGAYLTISEAMEDAERTCNQKISWTNRKSD